MQKLPLDLPEEIMISCKRVQEKFSHGGYYHGMAEQCLEAALQQGQNEKMLRALLVGLAACDDWLNDPTIKQWRAGAQISRELKRSIKESKYGSQAFESRKLKAFVYSDRGISQIQTAILYGYLLKTGSEKVSAPVWRPLFPILADIFNIKSSNADAVYEAIRQRVRRWGKQEDKTYLEETATQYFAKVYATL